MLLTDHVPDYGVDQEFDRMFDDYLAGEQICFQEMTRKFSILERSATRMLARLL